ncbi:MAG TPA: hypothetical protein PK280_14350, partial [Planctomycetota bacterium]|nr:hypothetical protein [Planctomycetota bacterium]
GVDDGGRPALGEDHRVALDVRHGILLLIAMRRFLCGPRTTGCPGAARVVRKDIRSAAAIFKLKNRARSGPAP